MPEMTDAQRIARARIQMLMKHVFFGTIAMRMQVEFTDEVKTFAVNGRDLFVNPTFLGTLSDDHVIGVLCHEVMHIALCHHLRIGERDPMIWNMACDYVINPIVVEAGLALPEGALFDQQFAGLSAETVYNKLLENAPPPPPEIGGGGFGEVLDGTQKPDGSTMTDDEVSLAETEVKMQVAEAAQTARQQGKLPASIAKVVGEMLKPKVNWKEALRRFVSNTVVSYQSYARPNRRLLAHGIRLPGTVKHNTGPIVIGLDTSGSIFCDEQVIAQFLSEVEAICSEAKPDRVHVVFCDAKVKAVEEFEHGEMGGIFDKLKASVSGGGGTDFAPVFDWVEANDVQPCALIYLTDMMGSFPKVAPEYPVLWAKTTDYTAPFGDDIRIQ